MPEESQITNIDINLLTPNRYQPRKVFNEETIQELALSIQEYGIINPILVRKNNNQYEIIAGERRWRAAKSIGLSQVPVIVKEIEDKKMAELALIENLQRESLTPIEEANSLKQIMELANITQENLGKMLGKSQSAIANKLRLLSLPTEIQEAINNKKISERHARSLLSVENTNYQIELLNKIITEKLSVKNLDELIKKDKISEEDMKISISDIMTSLKKSNEDNSPIDKLRNEKEEKESDNMNNGNFFPNFNNQLNQNQPQDLNASLNTLNMQSVNNPIPQQVNETVMPTPELNQQPIMQSPEINQNNNLTAAPMTYNYNEVNPIPDFAVNNTTNLNSQPILQEQFSNQQNIINPEVPIFNNEQSVSVIDNSMPTSVMENTMPEQSINNFNQPTTFENNNNYQETSNFNSIVQDAPLFSVGETLSPVENVNEPLPPQNIEQQPVPTTYEVPVMSEPATVPPVDNLTKTTEFLNQSNIPYKIYSNETGHCIIIEL